jgi:hypothetical protein
MILSSVFWIVALVVVGIPFVMFLFLKVHHTLDRICVRHARRYCEKKGLKVSRFRWQPAFDKTGVKTESTLVQLDGLDAQKQRKLVVILVWPFGVRKIVSDETYPDSYDKEWTLDKHTNSTRV